MFLKFMWRSKIYNKHPRTDYQIPSLPFPTPSLSLIPSLVFSVASPIHSSPGAHPLGLLSFSPDQQPSFLGSLRVHHPSVVGDSKREMVRSAAQSVGDGRASAATLGMVGAWQRRSVGSPLCFHSWRSSYVMTSSLLSFLHVTAAVKRPGPWRRRRPSQGGATELSGILRPG